MTIAPELARMIVIGGLRHLPPAQRARYCEECEADLAQLADGDLRMLIHALQTAAGARRLLRTLGVAPARPADPLRRRALAHIGVPVRLVEPRAHADASYVFAGTMRSRTAGEDDLPGSH